MDFTEECVCMCMRARERKKSKRARDGEREISALSDLFNHFSAMLCTVSPDEKGILTVFFLTATVAFQSRFICFPSLLKYEKIQVLIHFLST